MTTTIEPTEELYGLVDRVTRSIKKQFPRMEAADLQQEAWVWLYAEAKLVRENEENVGYLWTALRRHLRRYSEHWLADEFGYEPDDQQFYGIPQLKALLVQAFTPDWFEQGVVYDKQPGSGGGEPHDPATAWAMVADVKAAYAKLSHKDRVLLWEALGEPGEYKDRVAHLALRAGVDRSVMDQRIYDSLSRLRRHLGGGKPRD